MVKNAGGEEVERETRLAVGGANEGPRAKKHRVKELLASTYICLTHLLALRASTSPDFMIMIFTYCSASDCRSLYIMFCTLLFFSIHNDRIIFSIIVYIDLTHRKIDKVVDIKMICNIFHKQFSTQT
jgi:hypothetical protein